MNSRNVTMENVTASESTIRDADFAQETANMTREQILTQAGTSVLATANSTPQTVLTLLGH
jgi:flagellin